MFQWKRSDFRLKLNLGFRLKLNGLEQSAMSAGTQYGTRLTAAARMALTGVLVALSFGLTAAGAHAAGDGPEPSFFNSTEVRSKNLTPFTKWLSALDRYSKESKLNAAVTCPSHAVDICSYSDWTKFLDGLKDKDPLVQLNEINTRMNQASYVQDSQNWGQNDYWATPAEFMSKFGDCEDYAIVKYLSLRRLGWKENDLRVVAVKDLNLKVGHAVLIVFFTHPATGQVLPLLLDNQIKTIVNADRVRHYQPVFSLNKYFWWRHTPATG